MPVHTVNQGECIYSLAADHGMHWQTVWNDPENEDLRNLRQDPNLLQPGDEVFLRDFELQQLSCATEQKHKFKMKGVPVKLRVRIYFNGEPRANEEWKAVVDGSLVTGVTDKDGMMELRVNPRLHSIPVTLASGHRITLQLRHLDPLDTISGVQGRLSNLGYEPGPIDNIQGPLTTAAIKRFQADYPPLAVDGIVGPKTRGKLKEIYGC